MSYVLTDDDFNKLYVVKNQLGFMNSLVSTARRIECGVEELSSMFGALQDSIEAMMDSLEAREEIARLSDTIKNHEWVRIINLVSGRDSMSVSDIVKMDDKLALSVSIDPDSMGIFNAWRAVITDDGKNRMLTTNNGMGDFQVRFDRPTPPELPPVTEASILGMYGAKDAKDLVKRLVAMGNGADPAQLWKDTQKAKPKRRKREPLAA